MANISGHLLSTHLYVEVPCVFYKANLRKLLHTTNKTSECYFFQLPEVPCIFSMACVLLIFLLLCKFLNILEQINFKVIHLNTMTRITFIWADAFLEDIGAPSCGLLILLGRITNHISSKEDVIRSRATHIFKGIKCM